MPVEPRKIAASGAALLLAVGVAGCSKTPDTVPVHTAHVKIDGKDAGRGLLMSCKQIQDLWTIDAGTPEAGFTAQVEAGGAVTAKSVQLRNLGGFTGDFWEGNVGDGKATMSEKAVTVKGTAEGSFADNPGELVPVTFDITAEC